VRIEYRVSNAPQLPRDGEYLLVRLAGDGTPEDLLRLARRLGTRPVLLRLGRPAKQLSNSGWCKGGMIWDEVTARMNIPDVAEILRRYRRPFRLETDQPARLTARAGSQQTVKLRATAESCHAKVGARASSQELLYASFRYPPPITTPFYPDGNIYYKKLRSQPRAVLAHARGGWSCWARLARPYSFQTRSVVLSSRQPEKLRQPQSFDRGAQASNPLAILCS